MKWMTGVVVFALGALCGFVAAVPPAGTGSSYRNRWVVEADAPIRVVDSGPLSMRKPEDGAAEPHTVELVPYRIVEAGVVRDYPSNPRYSRKYVLTLDDGAVVVFGTMER